MKKSVFTFWIIFVFFLFIFILLLYIFMPLGQTFITSTIKASEDIIELQNSYINQIQNETVKQALLNATNSQISSLTEQHSILSTFYKYSWIIVILVVSLMMFILARKYVEYEQTMIR